MRLPPHALKKLRHGLAKEPDIRRRIARGWIIVGGLLVVFVTGMAVAHYVYGMPLQDRGTGELSTSANTLMTFVLIGGGGAFFLLMGILLRRWKP